MLREVNNRPSMSRHRWTIHHGFLVSRSNDRIVIISEWSVYVRNESCRIHPSAPGMQHTWNSRSLGYRHLPLSVSYCAQKMRTNSRIQLRCSDENFEVNCNFSGHKTLEPKKQHEKEIHFSATIIYLAQNVKANKTKVYETK